MDRRIAVISAAASGIGLAIAKALCADGWRVYAGDRDTAAIAALGSGSETLAARVCEVSDAASVEGFYAWIEGDLAAKGAVGIDLLVNNAGIAGPTARLEDQPLDGWNETVGVNLNGTFLMTRGAIPLLRPLGLIARIPVVLKALEWAYVRFLRVRPALQRMMR